MVTLTICIRRLLPLKFAQFSTFTVKEIKIPIPLTGGHLAGKLWQPTTTTPTDPKIKSHTPTICLHGIQDNCNSFDLLLPQLFNKNHHGDIYAFDLPGHGYSSHTRETYYHSFFDGLLGVHRVMRFFNWEKVGLLGHSLGAVVSFLFAAGWPEKLTTYTALDNLHPIPRADPTHGFQNVIAQTLSLEAKLSTKSHRPTYTHSEILEKTFQSRNGTLPRTACEILLQRGAEKILINDEARFRFTHDVKTNIKSSFRFLSADQIEKMAQRIATSDLRVCVIKGDPGEDFESREEYLKIVGILQAGLKDKCEYHVVRGGHHFHMEELGEEGGVEKVGRIVDRFWNKLN